MAWGDITITYNLDKGADTHYASFPFVKSTNNIHGAPQSGIYYTPAEIASFINTATSENVTKFSTDGEATTLVNGEWVGSLKNIYPWKGYHFNLSGDASPADYNINFIDAMATTSLDRGKYVAGEDYRIRIIKPGWNFIAYPFGAERSFSSVWNDPNSDTFDKIIGSAVASTYNSASGSWVGSVASGNIKAGTGWWVHSKLNYEIEDVEVWKPAWGSDTDLGRTHIDLQDPSADLHQSWAKMKYFTTNRYAIFFPSGFDGNYTTTDAIDPDGLPIGKGSKIYAYGSSDNEFYNSYGDGYITGAVVGFDFSEHYYNEERTPSSGTSSRYSINRKLKTEDYLVGRGISKRSSKTLAEKRAFQSFDTDVTSESSTGTRNFAPSFWNNRQGYEFIREDNGNLSSTVLFTGYGLNALEADPVRFRCWDSRTGKFFNCTTYDVNDSAFDMVANVGLDASGFIYTNLYSIKGNTTTVAP